MKKERFKNIGKDIFQYGEWWCSANCEFCAEVIASALNGLADEKRQYKKEVEKVITRYLDYNCCSGETFKILKEIWRELELDKMWLYD